MMTNREFNLAVKELFQRRPRYLSGGCYLLALLSLAEPYADRESLTVEEVLGMLAEADTSEPAMVEEAWRDQYYHLPNEQDGYAGWRERLIGHIVDLWVMEESGTFQGELVRSGATAAGRAYWFNFHPSRYPESAPAGSTGDGSPADGKPLEISWDDFKRFIGCGKPY